MIRRRSMGFAVAFGLAVVGGAPTAFAQSCGDDLNSLSQKRLEAMTSVNSLVEAAKGKRIDPTVFCGKSQVLNTIETKMLAYFEKNKDWCQIPDQTIEQLRAVHAKTVSFSGRACQAAAEMKKAKEQAAAGGGPQVQPLPAGPL